MSRRSPLPGVVVLLVDVGAFSSLFAVFRLVETHQLSFPAMGLWSGCLLVCYGLLWFMLRKGTTQRQLILVGGGMALVQIVAAMVHMGSIGGVIGTALVVGAWSASYFHAYTLAMTPPPAEKIIVSFEVCTLTLLFSLFYCSVQKIDFACALPAGVTALLALGALVARRTADGGRGGVRGPAVLLGAVGVFTAGALFLSGAAAGVIRRGAVGFWRAVRALGALLGRGITAVMAFLASLMPEPEGEILLEEPPSPTVPDGVVMENPMPDPDGAILVVLLLAAAALLALLVYLAIRGGGKIRISGGREVALRRRRPGFLRGLRRWFARLWARLVFACRTVLYRNTAPGLLLWLDRRSGRRGRRAGESCREFLTRLKPEYPGAEGALETLAEELDRTYFGGGSRLSRGEIRALRRRLRQKSPET